MSSLWLLCATGWCIITYQWDMGLTVVESFTVACVFNNGMNLA